MPGARLSKNAQRWERVVEAWTQFVRGGFDVYREYLNTPAMLKRIGSVRGLRILDLGCGEGYHCRLLARRGAKVTGVDATPGMIARAREEEQRQPLGVRYRTVDAARLQGIGRGRFDIVVAFMALMDVDEWRGAILEAARVLRPGGRFVFSVPHPCFDTVFRRGRMVSGWVREGGRPHKGRALYFRVDDYFPTRPYSNLWLLRGTTTRFRGVGWHITLSDLVNALVDAGLVIRHIDEPQPTLAGMRKCPQLRKVKRVPQSIVVDAMKLPLPAGGRVARPSRRFSRRRS